MARSFVDTSALTKLYHYEPDSLDVWNCLSSEDEILLAQITPLEVHSAFYGMRRQSLLSAWTIRRCLGYFQSDLPQYIIIPLNSDVLDEARRLIDAYASHVNLRPLDAIQLASALVEHRLVPIDAFVTTDIALANTAIAEGLTVKP